MLEKAVGALMGAIKLNAEDKRLYYTLAEVLMENMKFTEAQGVLQSLPERIRQELRWVELAAKCSAAIQSYQEAEVYADKVLAVNNASASALNIKGLVALNKGLNAEAEKFFEKALKADRGFAEAYANIGRIKWPSNKEAAFALFEKAFILSPFLSDVAIHYCNAVVSLSRFDRAEAIFRDAAALYPLNKRLRFFLKDMLLRTGKHAEAMEIKEADIESV
jgi:tetratricopeptide (TPR) repeat protein